MSSGIYFVRNVTIVMGNTSHDIVGRNESSDTDFLPPRIETGSGNLQQYSLLQIVLWLVVLALGIGIAACTLLRERREVRQEFEERQESQAARKRFVDETLEHYEWKDDEQKVEGWNNQTTENDQEGEQTLKQKAAIVAEEDEEAPWNHENCCSICLSPFCNGDMVSQSNNRRVCNHVFHRDCIYDWLLQHIECPMCRNEFLIPLVNRWKDVNRNDPTESVTAVDHPGHVTEIDNPLDALENQDPTAVRENGSQAPHVEENIHGIANENELWDHKNSPA